MAAGIECDSLFSLEIIVESVENIHVSCYKPAIVFRLLDFPTVVICPERQTLSTNEVSFEIQSGKSCLFKMNKEMLCERLQDTPLYIMLVDTSFKNTKLLASTTISLLSCFKNILASIESNGLDVPTVSGSNGEFPLYNLMGSQVATVRLRYRMFSFGVGMAGHVNLSLSKKIKQSKTKNIFTEFSSEQPEMAEEGSGQFKQPLHELENSDRKLVVPDIVKDDHSSRTNAHTQTDNNTKQLSVTPQQEYNNPEPNSIHHHNNILRPPPLYYNSTSTITLPTVAPVALGRLVKCSNDDLIKPRAISASFEKSAKSPNEKNNFRPQYCDTSVQTSQIFHDNVPSQGLHTNDDLQSDRQLDLPLIEALLNELSLVRTKYAGIVLSQQINGGPTSHCNNKEVKILETGHAFLKREQTQDKKVKKIKVCPGTKKSIPTRANSKGVLISRHPIKFRKSSLKYGTTKTQKLREAKNKSFLPEQNLEQADFQRKEGFLRQDNNGHNNNAFEPESIHILKENKSTMTQDDELQCKDVGIQVKISDDKFPSSLSKHLNQESLMNGGGLNHVSLGATYINGAVPLSSVVNTNHADGNTGRLLSHNDPSANKAEELLFSNKPVLANPGEFPTFSNVSPTVPSNSRWRKGERSSKESQEKSNSLESSLSNRSLGLIDRPVDETHSNSERSSNNKLQDASRSSDSRLSGGSLGLENKPAVEAGSTFNSETERSNYIKGLQNEPVSSDGRLSDEMFGLETKPTARSEKSSKESVRDKSISSDSRLSGKSLGLVNKPVGDVLSMSSYSDHFESDASDHTRGSSAS